MNKGLEKKYDPKVVEDNIYDNWIKNKYFKSVVDKDRIPYTIVMPPPNITGQLHMGHALNSTLQDILIRFKRMQGYNTLWLPGTDHASISTELKIVEDLAKKGLKKEDVGRANFLKLAWEWKDKYGGKIIGQFKKLGTSCDWDRERFTMDKGLSNAVEEVFIKLYNKGYIYRGEKLINWCCKCKTTISDAEVDHIENDSYLWYFKYRIKDREEFLEFATTRPETLLGDTAIAVNPNDKRYKKYVGLKAVVPIVNREIPIIEDDYVEMNFGTGVVKITPAHDPNDFEMGIRHNLSFINIMNDDGTINENGGKYSGLDRYEARDKIVNEFNELGLFTKKESLKNSIGIHERCNTVIEPLIKRQWFVKMKELSKPAIEALKNEKIKFVPSRFGKIYLNWLEDIRDWCISRQLWWGHRIPAYYCLNCDNIVIDKKIPQICDKCNSKNIKQDEDTLDTWFSSALWPFSTLGWPSESEDLRYFYPTNVLVTAYDIIFFWIVRMVFSGIEQMNDIPFKDVLIHGLVRDSEGKKMSKSLGNGIDPLEIIDKYGTDSLRLTLVLGNSPGNDQRFYLEKVKSNRNFLTKLWNATRFIIMNLENVNIYVPMEELTLSDKWIISKQNKLILEVTSNMENYELGLAISKVQTFIWEEYCDWYIEMVKFRIYDKDDKTRNAALWTLKEILINSLKLLHPYIPFITEKIFTSIQIEEETIMFSKWPKYRDKFNFNKEEKEIEFIKNLVKDIRNMRAEMNVLPFKRITTIVVSKDENVKNILENNILIFKNLGYIDEVIIKENYNIGSDFVSIIIPNGVIYIPVNELIDIDKEIKRLKKEKVRLENEVNRVEKKLSNNDFVMKAPEKLILGEKEKYIKYKSMLDQVNSRLLYIQNE